MRTRPRLTIANIRYSSCGAKQTRRSPDTGQDNNCTVRALQKELLLLGK